MLQIFGKRFFSQKVSSVTTTAALRLDTLLGIDNKTAKVYRNLEYSEIAQHEAQNKEGEFTNENVLNVMTGKFTGRSPKDKFIVQRSPSKENIWWGEVNQPISSKSFDELYEIVKKHYKSEDQIYVFDGYCGANEATRKNVRIITSLAWQHHFVKNMFIRPKTSEELIDFKPDFTIINACKVEADKSKTKELGLNSEVFVAFDVEKEVGIIGGTWYGGEMKKGIFGMMNYWLPLEGIMPMHCSANVSEDHKDCALFFGLSGTGKTTLSADPKRKLIGDDEHGWDEEGVFNFEGGCYAKVINLKRENEPDIYDAIKPNALLENVVLDPKSKIPRYEDGEKTQNTRVSYPLEHIKNYEPSSKGPHPKNIIFLTCDAYGVLPPIAKLSCTNQAMYHFLSGYTAKVAGTERGVHEPSATFSACFGAAFMTLHPSVYADLLQKKIEKHQSNVFLVNTGWTGGKYGMEGAKRMSIRDTRECIDMILSGKIGNEEIEFRKDEVFGFDVPIKLGQIDEKVLNPKQAWKSQGREQEYEEQRKKLAKMFVENYKKYISKDHTDFSAFGPKI